MKIIGHRGAAGLAPENTIKAILTGIKAGADAVEFDVRRTKDGIFVLSHDVNLERLTGSAKRVKYLTLKELQEIKRIDSEPWATLEEALNACGSVTTLIEPKENNWAEDLAKTLSPYGDLLHAAVISFNYMELIALHSFMPDVPCYLLERHNAFKASTLARQNGLAGIDLNYWLLNPLTYFFARIRKLDIIIYTVDHPILLRWFSFMYPKVIITTNRPDILSKIINKNKSK